MLSCARVGYNMITYIDCVYIYLGYQDSAYNNVNTQENLIIIDLKHICQNLNQFGYGKGTKHGGLSQYTVVPAKYAYLLRTALDDSRAAILERKKLICVVMNMHVTCHNYSP